ncbi:MAG: VCBS repeat-containing protein [Ginsengibacter sp.]
MKRLPVYIVLGMLPIVLLVTGFIFFPQPGKKQTTQLMPPTGEELARIYCATCHVFPEPSLLDKSTWKEHVLPNMGWRLGIRKPGDEPFAAIEKDDAEIVKALNVYPDQALITKENWQKIVAYFLLKAPDKPLPQKPPLAFEKELTGFHAQALFIGNKKFPKTSLLKFDPATSLLYIGDAQNELYAVRGSNSKLVASWKVESPPVDIDFPASGFPRVLCIGSISPSEKKTGSLYSLDSNQISPGETSKFEKLARPVQFAEADLNGDGKKDLVICQFGNHTGKLSWFDGGDPEKEHILKLQPGARKVEIKDVNGDGKPDIIALMAQAREELTLFTNKGNNQFSEKVLYTFPPVYGVSYFELDDFNKDGHPDILVTNGDNWDLSPVRKNYHGIRILMNDGKNNFKVSHFFPLYGCSKAIARDFDHDGDLDIAAISFYDDPANPSDAFLYLENKGSLHFSAESTPLTGNGKWLTMEVGDLNHDGYDDIVLGSYIYSMGELTKLLKKGVESFPQTIILWNDKKK